MYICIYVYMYICIYVHLYTCMYTCMKVNDLPFFSPLQEIMPWSTLERGVSGEDFFTFDAPENEAFGLAKPPKAQRWKASGI